MIFLWAEVKPTFGSQCWDCCNGPVR